VTQVNVGRLRRICSGGRSWKIIHNIIIIIVLIIIVIIIIVIIFIIFIINIVIIIIIIIVVVIGTSLQPTSTI
jgi:hypothetical protein